jgi:nickel/cobalt transporter (NicO) family protein
MRKLVVLTALAASLLVPATATAHPLGNFSVNRYAGIELSGENVYVHYVLDLAEIPTYQEGERVRAPGFAATVGRRLMLHVDGRRIALAPVEHTVASRPGAGGLDTLRFEAVYEANAGGGKVVFRDANFSNRLGWKEIVVRASEGASISSSTAPKASTSDALRAYPKQLLSSPLDVTSARVAYEPGEGPGTRPVLSAAGAEAQPADGFASLITREDLGLGVILVSLLVAMFWGAAHALTPGHGKAIVAAYLVGTRGTARHAFLLGGIVTLTHTIGVFALGLVTLTLSEFVVPEALYPWLNLVSAVLVVLVGIAVLRLRVVSWLRPGRARSHAHHHHHHGGNGHGHHHHHHHGHGHDHGHSHVPEPGSGLRGLVAVGVSGGLLPCPTALVVLLAAISLHRVGYGLLLIIAFSLGLAAMITGIGLIAVTAKRAFSRMSFQSPVIRLLPAVSALVIIGLGIAMTVRAVPSVA